MEYDRVNVADIPNVGQRAGIEEDNPRRLRASARNDYSAGALPERTSDDTTFAAAEMTLGTDMRSIEEYGAGDVATDPGRPA